MSILPPPMSPMLPDPPSSGLDRPWPTPPSALSEIGGILQRAVDKGTSAEEIRELLSLYREMQAMKAEQEFNVAFTAYQGECPKFRRTSGVDTVTKKGARIKYDYADMEEIGETARPVLCAHGLSFNFVGEVKIEERGNMLLLWTPCTLRHVAGHKETQSFPIPVDREAYMSAPQQFASALTFGKRQALLMVLGAYTADPDNDAAAPETLEPITPEQVGLLITLLRKSKSDKKRFLAFMHVDSLDKISQARYPEAIAALQRKLAQVKGMACGPDAIVGDEGGLEIKASSVIQDGAP